MMASGWTIVAGLIAALAFGAPNADRAQAQPSRAGSFVTPPSDDFRRAQDLFASGQREEAVFWFYRAQLRARAHLEARSDPQFRKDHDLVASMAASVGKPINDWAFEDVPGLVVVIERVLSWHQESDDLFTPKARYPEAHAKARIWLAEHLIELQASRDGQRLSRLRSAPRQP